MKLSETRIREIIKEEVGLLFEKIAGESLHDDGSTASTSADSSDGNNKKAADGVTLYGDTQAMNALGRYIINSTLRPSSFGYEGATISSFTREDHRQGSGSNKKCPSVFLILLGGNIGSDIPSTLVDNIRASCPDSKIVWSGAPRVAEGARVSHTDRQSVNRHIQASLSGIDDVIFVDPYDHMSEWSIESGDDEDGLILPERVANEYGAILVSTVQDAS
jgi:hypothetical protein